MKNSRKDASGTQKDLAPSENAMNLVLDAQNTAWGNNEAVLIIATHMEGDDQVVATYSVGNAMVLAGAVAVTMESQPELEPVLIEGVELYLQNIENEDTERQIASN